MAIGKVQFSYVLVFFLLFISLSVMAVQLRYRYEECGSEKLHLKNITVNPISDETDPQWGWDMTITVFSNDGQSYDCEGKYLSKVIKIGTLRILTTESELCAEVSRDVASPSELQWKDKIAKVEAKFWYEYSLKDVYDDEQFCLKVLINTISF